MKFKAQSDSFLPLLQKLTQVVPSRSPRPVLSHIHLNASKEVITLTACDLEVSLSIRQRDLEVLQPGVGAVPAQKMMSLFREIEGAPFECEAGPTEAKILSQGKRLRFACEDAEEFPEVPKFDQAVSFELPALLLKEMIQRASFATAQEKSRYAMNGACLVVNQEFCEMTSTDGRRLVTWRCPFEKGQGPNEEKRAIIPVKAMSTLVRCFEDHETIGISLDDHHALFFSENILLDTRLVSGVFPDYEAVIPKKFREQISFPKTNMMGALRMAALLTSEASRSVTFTFGEGPGVVIRSQSPEHGDAEIPLECACEVSDVEYRLNPEYLLDALKAVPGDEVVFCLNDAQTPAMLTDDGSFRYLISPISTVHGGA